MNEILENIDVDRILHRLEYCISNRALITSPSPLRCIHHGIELFIVYLAIAVQVRLIDHGLIKYLNSTIRMRNSSSVRPVCHKKSGKSGAGSTPAERVLRGEYFSKKNQYFFMDPKNYPAQDSRHTLALFLAALPCWKKPSLVHPWFPEWRTDVRYPPLELQLTYIPPVQFVKNHFDTVDFSGCHLYLLWLESFAKVWHDTG